ncbi:MAG: DUF4870 domain-containing protein [Planctomycetota bacterium]|nr:DUF4870 domain-containing protein [Planctomycetota bacterium]
MQEPSDFRGSPEEVRPIESQHQPTGAASSGPSPEKPAEIDLPAARAEPQPAALPPQPPPEPAPQRPTPPPPPPQKPEEFANRPGSAAGAPPREPRTLDANGEPRRSSGWAVACHLLGLVDFGVSVLFLGLIATLCAWLIAKDKDPEADFHGKEALNFQLNILFWQVLAVPLCCCLIGGPLALVLPFAKLFLMIVAAVKAANGERWRYPLVVRVLR